ncbi:HAD hydrolase-like protein, partial [bacterium]|nr:HAD hydrolase-like protein [bacterium]
IVLSKYYYINRLAFWTPQFMTGDKPADIEAGVSAGCRSFLVETGYGGTVGSSAEKKCEAVFPDLPAVIDHILGESFEQPNQQNS